MTSPLCLVNGFTTTDGVDVTQNTTVTIQLIDTAGVNTWEIVCIGTDEATTPATINASLVIIDIINKTATFTMPDYEGVAVVFQSKVNLGRDVNGRVVPAYTTTFKVDTIVNGNRCLAMNETLENNASFGWIGPINKVIRESISLSTPILGDVSGTIQNTHVDKLKGRDLDPALGFLSVSQDNYSLAWNNSNDRWQATLITAVGSAGGDLSGTYPNPTVAKIRGKTLATTISSIGAAEDGYSLTWNNSAGEWRATYPFIPPNGSAGGDLSGTYPSPTVVGLYGRDLDSALATLDATNDGYVLTWINSLGEWRAQNVGTGSSAPSGSAGGDLTGSYPNPTIKYLTGVDNGFSVNEIYTTTENLFLIGKTNTGAGNYGGSLAFRGGQNGDGYGGDITIAGGVGNSDANNGPVIIGNLVSPYIQIQSKSSALMYVGLNETSMSVPGAGGGSIGCAPTGTGISGQTITLSYTNLNFATASTSATAGGSQGYLIIQVNGVNYKINFLAM